MINASIFPIVDLELGPCFIIHIVFYDSTKRPYYIWIVTASSAQGPMSKMAEHEPHKNF